MNKYMASDWRLQLDMAALDTVQSDVYVQCILTALNDTHTHARTHKAMSIVKVTPFERLSKVIAKKPMDNTHHPPTKRTRSLLLLRLCYVFELYMDDSWSRYIKIIACACNQEFLFERFSPCPTQPMGPEWPIKFLWAVIVAAWYCRADDQLFASNTYAIIHHVIYNIIICFA